MNLDGIWTIFLRKIKQDKRILSVKRVDYVGIPFLYIETESNTSVSDINRVLQLASAHAMKNLRLNSYTIYLRSENIPGNTIHVYRHRFLVPQEKMFCCGNICTNCVRFRS